MNTFQLTLRSALISLIVGTLPSAAAAQELTPSASTEGAALGPVAAPAATSHTQVDGGAQQSSTIRDRSAHERSLSVSALAYVPWWYGLGVGGIAGVEIPVLHDGFIGSINDQVSIEPSFGVATLSWRDSMYGAMSESAMLYRPAIAGVWSFHISPRLRVFGALDVGYTRVSREWEAFDTQYEEKSGYFYTELSAGLFYKLAEHVALRTQLGWQGLRVGVSMP